MRSGGVLMQSLRILVVVACFVQAPVLLADQTTATTKPNILFISVDALTD